MTLPTTEQYRGGCTRWNREYKGVQIELSHHGVSEWQPQGTWCYYLYLHENMFQRPEDFAPFDLPYQYREFSGKKHRHYPYDDAPDLRWHGGPTFGERITGYDRDAGEPYSVIKIGCDYAHSWDQEGGYWQGFDDVLRDAEQSVDELVAHAPMKVRCGYCGRIDMPDQFYTAINGKLIHKKAAVPPEWADWHPAPEAAA